MMKLFASINTVQMRLKKLQTAKSKVKTSLHNSRTRYLKTVATFRAKLETVIHYMEMNTNNTMERLYRKRSAKIDKHLALCESAIQGLEETVSILIDKNISDSKRFVAMKHGRDTVLESSKLANVLSQPINYDIEFELDKTILSTMETLENLGHFKENPAPAMSSEIKSVKNYVEQNIRADVDKSTCDIQGMCMLLDGSVVLSDHKNQNIKRLDEDYVVKETLSMPGKPHSICCTDNKELAIALGSKKKVQFVSVTDKMRRTFEVSFNHPCCGIAYSKSTLYLTQSGTIARLSVYSLERGLDGYSCTLLRTFDGSCPRSVAVSGDGNFVYLVGNDDKLTIQDKTGAHVMSTEHPNLKKYGEHPGVCVDMKGNILVSMKYDGILQFKDSGQEPIGLLVKDTVTRPEVAFVDNIRSKLLVQRNNRFGGNDTLGVWDMLY